MELRGRGLPTVDPLLFAELMLSHDLGACRAAEAVPEPAFFDRGIPDIVGHLRLTSHPVPAHVQRAAALCRYSRRAFVLPPWPEIYQTDAERRQSPAEAERTYRCMTATYGEFGYDLCEVPRGPIDAGVHFVRAYRRRMKGLRVHSLRRKARQAKYDDGLFAPPSAVNCGHPRAPITDASHLVYAPW